MGEEIEGILGFLLPPLMKNWRWWRETRTLARELIQFGDGELLSHCFSPVVEPRTIPGRGNMNPLRFWLNRGAFLNPYLVHRIRYEGWTTVPRIWLLCRWWALPQQQSPAIRSSFTNSGSGLLLMLMCFSTFLNTCPCVSEFVSGAQK